MGTTVDDAYRDMAIQQLHDEAVMERAAREQSILLLVEGDSEEVAFPILFTDIVDFDVVGVRIGNYSGEGSLRTVMRLLRNTICYKYPIIVTHDNDPPSIAALHRCEKDGLLDGAVYSFAVPAEGVVRYESGHVGGSFEESFPLQVFLDEVFAEGLLPEPVTEGREQFEAEFVPDTPWLAQVRKFTAERGFTEWAAKKTVLAEALACACDELPDTYAALAELIERVRKEHPVSHPDDVDMPRVPGLTC